MGNPFDGTGGAYLVLCNEERQHSLWPADLDVPGGEGWSTGARAGGARFVCGVRRGALGGHASAQSRRSLAAVTDQPTR